MAPGECPQDAEPDPSGDEAGGAHRCAFRRSPSHQVPTYAPRPYDPGVSVAIVHDYLNQRGGAERVVLEMSRIWPDAPVYTSLYRPESTFSEFQDLDIRTSPLQRLPVDKGFRNLLALYPLAFRSFGILKEELVVSSSSGWAHAVRTRPQARHVVYCYTPARWLYGGEYLGASGRQRALEPMAPLLRAWDRRAARKPDLYIAISNVVRERIKRVYGRDAPVVYPPVDTERFTPSPRGERLLVVSRLLPYKRVDVVVAAATKAGIGLDVVGEGPALAQLRRMAGPSVVFHGKLDDRAVTALMQNARAVCVPGAEDFGIVPVEAQAAGKPVVAFGAGGALETLEDGFSGALFERHDVECVLDAIRRCDTLTSTPEDLARRAERFSHSAFRSALIQVIEREGAESKRVRGEAQPVAGRTDS
jgi:glycosyltransferase involved in cell wall biosynthesis